VLDKGTACWPAKCKFTALEKLMKWVLTIVLFILTAVAFSANHKVNKLAKEVDGSNKLFVDMIDKLHVKTNNIKLDIDGLKNPPPKKPPLPKNRPRKADPRIQ
jgi:undecaprenyl pyrophosphate synthase